MTSILTSPSHQDSINNHHARQHQATIRKKRRLDSTYSINMDQTTTTTDYSLPRQFANQDLPSLASLTDSDVGDDHNTVRWFNVAKDFVTIKSAPVFDSSTMSQFPMKRLAKVLSVQKKEGRSPFSVKYERPQAADSLIKYMYGDVQEGKKACTRCEAKKGTPYAKCVTLDALSEGCASCHYHGKARLCSLNKSTKRKHGDDNEEPQKRRKVKDDMQEREMIRALQTIPSEHLKTFADVMESLITRADKTGDFDD